MQKEASKEGAASTNVAVQAFASTSDKPRRNGIRPESDRRPAAEPPHPKPRAAVEAAEAAAHRPPRRQTPLPLRPRPAAAGAAADAADTVPRLHPGRSRRRRRALDAEDASRPRPGRRRSRSRAQTAAAPSCRAHAAADAAPHRRGTGRVDPAVEGVLFHLQGNLVCL